MASVTPDIPELFEEAYEMAGLQLRSGYQLKSLRRSLNLLLLEWQNRGLNLFTVEEGTLPLTEGTATYTMPTGTIDLIEHQLRTGTGTNQLDRKLQRMSVSTYAQQGSKNTRGAPSQIYVNRQANSVEVTVWPVPDSNNYTLFFYRLKAIDGMASGIAGDAAVPPRFVPALVAGLAYRTAMKEPDALDRVEFLKMNYEQEYELAAQEDQDASDWEITPWMGHI